MQLLHKIESNLGLRLLYMSTRSHDDDDRFMECVRDCLRALYPGSVELYFVGVWGRLTLQPPRLRVWDPLAHLGASYPALVHRLRGARVSTWWSHR